MKKVLSFIIVACICIASCARPLGRWVNPFIGTDYTGHTSPSAACPLGMVQPGPQSGNYLWKYCSGYNWSDSLLIGFTQNRLSGTGCPSLCNVLVMPFSDKHGAGYASRKKDEKASPGYYAVRLPDNGTKVEITCSERVACYEVESVSRTLEFCYDDWCAAQLAKALGYDADYEFFAGRSKYYRNLFDPQTGFFRGKDSAGNWREPFEPARCAHAGKMGGDFTEGSALHYLWHVLQDPQDLIELMGGPGGLCGNDDCGQMSAWYIFSALGYYPVNPVGGEFVKGEAQVKVLRKLPWE